MPRKSFAAVAAASSRTSKRQSPRLRTINNDKDETQGAEEDATIQAHSSESESEEEEHVFAFEGTVYSTYQEMVDAKRKRNEDYLKQHGLWNPMQSMPPRQEASQNGIKRRRVGPTSSSTTTVARRKSSRLAGTPADGLFIEHEGGGNVVIRGSETAQEQVVTTTRVVSSSNGNGRINDGASLSMEEAIQMCDPKWIQEDAVETAKQLTRSLVKPAVVASTSTKASTSPTSVVVGLPTNTSMATLRARVQELSIDDGSMVAKVTPDRIYSVSVHPSTDHLLVAAGDKNGYCGLWNVSSTTSGSSSSGVHLFRYHTRPVNALEWTSSQGLLSSSYDGTVRYFDVASESFEEIFATPLDDDNGNYYTQHLALDPRAPGSNHSFFLSTSMGSVLHVDRRLRARNGGNVTFHANMSEKKINSVSLHRDGYCLATAGLDRTVKLWDLRKMSSSDKKVTKPSEPKGALLGQHDNKLSVSSAFFSPSGDYLVSTNMANTLNIYHKAHLQVSVSESSSKKKEKNGVEFQPAHVIRHDNRTGRWLTTFMAQWHPSLDIFCVGSMSKPRSIDVFDGASGDHLRAIQGDALSAVASRCCFHPSSDQLIVVGGNSSGRVTVIR